MSRDIDVRKRTWEEVYAASKAQSHFVSYEYAKLWYSCFAQADEVFICEARQGERTMGIVPLQLRRKRGLRTLRTLTNDHCPQSGPVVRQGCESVFADRMLDALLEDKGWDVLVLEYSYSFGGCG